MFNPQSPKSTKADLDSSGLAHTSKYQSTSPLLFTELPHSLPIQTCLRAGIRLKKDESTFWAQVSQRGIRLQIKTSKHRCLCSHYRQTQSNVGVYSGLGSIILHTPLTRSHLKFKSTSVTQCTCRHTDLGVCKLEPNLTLPFYSSCNWQRNVWTWVTRFPFLSLLNCN